MYGLVVRFPLTEDGASGFDQLVKELVPFISETSRGPSSTPPTPSRASPIRDISERRLIRSSAVRALGMVAPSAVG
jgi:hypothetical protein